jgi:hypothetical protein
VGVDLGQARDHTAIVVVERVGGGLDRFDVRHAERAPLGTAYPAIVERVSAIATAAPLRGRSTLVVDATGVGRPVVDLFVAAGLRPIGVTITAGAAPSGSGDARRAPKRELCTLLQVLLQSGRLKIAASMPACAALVEELLAFRVRIDGASARDSYGAGGSAHDDLVMALALACYGAGEAPAIAPVVGVSEPHRDEDDDPWDHSWVVGGARPVLAREARVVSLPGVSAVTPAERRIPPYFVR